MKYLSKRNDVARKIRSFWKHFGLMTEIIVLAIAVVVVWLVFQRYGIYFPDGPAEVTVTAILVFVVPYALFAQSMLTAGESKSRSINDAVTKKSKRLFMRYRDERVRTMMHILVLVPAICIVIVTGMCHYPAVWVGALVIFMVTLVLSLPWIMLRELQDVWRNRWVMERVPPDWLADDVDEYFKLHHESPAAAPPINMAAAE